MYTLPNYVMVDFAINQPAHYLSNVMLHLVYIYPVQAVDLVIRMLIPATFIRCCLCKVSVPDLYQIYI